MERRIIHLDMDAFYASVEQRDRPELRGRPVAVGGSSRRAVVAAASYEARTFGVRSAMPMFRARHLCPELVVVDLRMEHYRAVSQQIRAILEAHTELIEPLALDEFYLDVSATTASIVEAGALARRMKEEIRSGTGLTASAGVAPSKFVAKIASDLRKPDGLVIVEPDAVVAFLAPLPVSRMWGVGQVTERRLKELGIHTLADIAATDPARLGDLLGKHGPRMVEFARGADPRGVQVSRQPKSVSNETTFEEDTSDLSQLAEHIARLAQRVAERLQRRGLLGRTVVLKLTYRNFQHVTRRTTLTAPTGDADVIAAAARALLDRSAAASRLVRLVGVGVSGLGSGGGGAQLSLLASDPQGGDETPWPTPPGDQSISDA
jgi:DNA polymerase-4